MSRLTPIVEALVCAGASPEMILAAVRAHEAAAEADIEARRKSDAERQARRRDRLKGEVTASHVTSRDVTVTERDTPCPLPSSPHTPQQPTPTPGVTTRARKGRPEKPYPDDFEAAWKAYPHTEGRSSKPETLARWLDLSETDRAALPAACDRYRREGREPKADCGAPAMERWLKRSLHQHWMAKAANDAAPSGPVDPAVQARRLRRFRDTGVWEHGWGPMPDLSAQPDQSAAQGAAA